MGGTTGTGNKTAGSTNSTGQPAWTSGSGNTSPDWASNGSIGSGATTAAQGGSSTSGFGAPPPPGSDDYNTMNTNLSTSPMQALNSIFQTGGNGPQAQQVLNNLLGTSGSNSGMDIAGQMYKNLGGSGTNNFQGVYDAAGGPGANEQYLTDYASGKMMNSNPYLDAITQKAEQDAMSGVNQMFAAGGRYGSGMNQGTTAQAIADANNKFRGDEYEAESGRRLTAANQIGNEQAARFGIQNNAAQGVGNLQSAAAQGLGGLGSDAMKNWLTAQQNAGTLGSQGTQNMLNGMGQLGAVQANKVFDANQQLNVGNATTAQSQQQINDLIDQYTKGDMSDWARTGGLLSAGTGAAGNWGTTNSTQKSTSSPGAANILGGILGTIGMM